MKHDGSTNEQTNKRKDKNYMPISINVRDIIMYAF